MKISYSWLRELASLDEAGTSIEGVSEALTALGLAVEGDDRVGDDRILDIDVTTNRPDCLNHFGVARELAVRFSLALSPPDWSAPEANSEKRERDFPVRVEIADPDLCPRYAARLMTGVRLEESPEWLRRRLESLGQRPINNIVDITNYVLFELGHPLHAFDYEKLTEGRIVVRRAREGESIQTLDGEERAVDSSMLMICDAVRPVAVAGVMGGEESEISSRSRSILLESAYFEPAGVRRTSRHLGLRTEASYRFERGADPEMPVRALNRTCRLIEEIAGGECVGPVVDEFPAPVERPEVLLTADRLRRVVGISFESEFILRILRGLGFEVLSYEGDRWRVGVPSFRGDVAREDDLVEEVVRHFGYDKVPSTYPAPGVPGRRQPGAEQERIIASTLQGAGFSEAYNMTFRSLRKEAEFWGAPPRMVAIANPLTEEDTHLRTSLMPGLVESVRHNLNHGVRDVRLFEMGTVFAPGASGNPEDLTEEPRLSLVATGLFLRPFWNQNRDPFHFLHFKGVLELLFQRLRLEVEFRRAEQSSFLHPGAAADVFRAGRKVGLLGELHPELRERYKFLQKVFAAELSLLPTFSETPPEPRFEPLDRFPVVERDLSFVVDKAIEFAKIKRAIDDLDIPELREIQVLDLYHGSQLPAGKVSLTLHLAFSRPDRTLTQDEIAGFGDRIVEVLESAFGAKVRS